MKHYSYSRLNLFDACPRLYKLKYIDKVPEAPSVPLEIGKLVHQIIAAYDMHLLDNGLQTDVTVLSDLTRKIFFNPPEPHHLGLDHLEEIEQIIETFGGSHLFNPATTVGIEEHIKLPLGPEMFFWSVLDRLEIDGKTAIIVDYKTDWQIRSQSDAEKDLQLQIYAWIVSKEYPQVENFRGRLEFVRHAVVREVEIDAAVVAKTEQKVLAMIDQIEKETVFAPRPGAACSWCGYVEMCPALKNLGAGQVICKSREDAVRIAGELALLEKQIEDRKKALKLWCTVNGPVENNGLAWGFFLTIYKGVEDAKRFAEIVTKHGKDPYDFFSVDGRKIKPLWNDPCLAAELNAIAVDKSYTTFVGRKLKEDEVA